MNYRINVPLSATIFYKSKSYSVNCDSSYWIDKTIRLCFNGFNPPTIATRILRLHMPWSFDLLSILQAPLSLHQEINEVIEEITDAFSKQMQHLLVIRIGL